MDALPPLELRCNVYEFGYYTESMMPSKVRAIPWARTILMTSVLNDKEALKLASIQGEDQIGIICTLIAMGGIFQCYSGLVISDSRSTPAHARQQYTARTYL
jgi:hypothetical protein